MVEKKLRKLEQWQDMITRLYPEFTFKDNTERVLSRTVTFQVTDACNLACTYCYQINKGKRRMSFDTAKKFIDLLLSGEKGFSDYINPKISPAIVLEFIGGEPFLEVELIDKIVDYFRERTIELMHPWATNYCISICSNGVLYFDERVQKFLNKNKDHMSFSITIDGNKELHDSCRVFPDGRPSYDMAVAGANDWIAKGNYMGSKITIAPGNLNYLYDAIIHMINLGYLDINANCVYEKGWEQEHAVEFYKQLKNVADYFIDNDLVGNVYCSLFEENFFKPKSEDDLQNWCWIAGTPILTTEGYKPIEEIKIGDLVYTEDGTIQPVINTMSHFANNVVEISASGIFKLGCTNNHKLFAKPFDYIGFNYHKHYKDYGKYEVQDLKNKDLIKLFQLPKGQVNYNINLAYLIGRYIGDGWNYDKGKGFGICCSFDEKEELENKFKMANVDYHYNVNKTVGQFTIARNTDNLNNKELIRILSTCGCLAHGKHLPPECFNWQEVSLSALLNGYMDADGYIKKNNINVFNTVSYTLAQELMVILRTLGYTPTCYKNNRAGESMILGRKVNIRDRYEVYFYSEPSKAKYVKSIFDGMWTSNLHSEPIEPQEVYNITVANNHSYIAGGLVSSNCGGTGFMLSCDPDGYLYPCIRYMESSLGDSRPPMRIGSVFDGLGQNKCHMDCIHCLKSINRRTQSTDECFYCPIGEGCSWCSAYNFQEFGTPNKRATYICEMHKARSLANVYFWNKYYQKNGIDKKFKMYCPKEWALKIISEKEYDMLLKISE